MNKTTLILITTRLFPAASLLMMLFLAWDVVPSSLGQRVSKEALNAQEAMKATARADVPLIKAQSVSPSTPQVCTLDGTLGTPPAGGTTGTLTTRLFRGGVPTTCSSAPYPGTTGTGPFIYNEHTITNPTASPLCTNVTLHYVSGGTATVNIQIAAFMSPFTPPDISTPARYLGDPGLSSGSPPGDTTFAVNVPASATISLVVFNVNAAPAGAAAVYQIILDQDQFCGPPAPSIVAAGSTLTAESCSPPNSAIDPGETVSVDFKLMNNGGAATTSLVATLQATGGVTNPSGPQNYGAIPPGGMASRTFMFTADSTLVCGGTITATLQLNDNGNPLPSVTFNFTTGALVPSFSENFDGVTPPALPTGWTADQGTNAGGFPLWETSNSGLPTPVADTSPNAAFSQDPNNILDNRIYTPAVMYGTGSQLTFKQNYDLEQSSATVAFDAGVLEISVNGGVYQDILAAGGTFAQGGYNHTSVSTAFGNPLLADHCPGGSCGNWSGISNGGVGGFEMCVVNLPASGAGQPVQFRWRMGSDDSVSHAGWRVDTVSIAQRVCCGAAPTVASAVSLKTHGATPFGINLPLTGTTGVECRTGGATNDYTIKVTFSGNVTVTGSPQAQVIMGTATIGSGGVSNGGMVTVMGNMVTIPLTNVADQQTIQVRLNGVNNASASDVPAVDVVIPMSRLLGDSNGNRSVNSGDILQVKQRVGQAVTAANFRSDLNANGSINAGDVSIAKQNTGHAVP